MFLNVSAAALLGKRTFLNVNAAALLRKRTFLNVNAAAIPLLLPLIAGGVYVHLLCREMDSGSNEPHVFLIK